MGKSKRDSPCPGCIVVKSMHTFRKPGKDCEGPPGDGIIPEYFQYPPVSHGFVCFD